MNGSKNDMDLGLALGISNQCVQKLSKNNPGAGVNAESREDMAFVATDPLSELVWSPKNGLSLKCAGRNLTNKNPALQWDVGPGNVVFSPSHGIESQESMDGKSISGGNSVASQVDRAVGECASSPKSLRGKHDNLGEVHGIEDVSFVNFNELLNCSDEYVCNSKRMRICNVAETRKTSLDEKNKKTADFLPLLATEHISCVERPKFFGDNLKDNLSCGGKIEDVTSSSMRLGFCIKSTSRNHSIEQCEPVEDQVPDLPSASKRGPELTLTVDRRRVKVKENASTSAIVLKELEATAENDVQHLTVNSVHGQNEERVEKGNHVPGEASSGDSRICLYQRSDKGKDKFSSYWGSSNKISDNDDNSHESMESCNTANLLLKGKRQWSFNHQLILGNRGIEKKIEESPLSPVARPDSSFMNWISNMVKGLGKSHQKEGDSVALSIGHSGHEHENYDQKISLCNKICDFERRSIGFQDVFQSLYSPDTNAIETGIPVENCSVGRTKGLPLADKPCEGNDSLKHHSFGYGECTSTHVCKSKPLSNLTDTEAKNGSSSFHSSRGVNKRKSPVEGNSWDLFSATKTTKDIGDTSNPLGSLWVTRFCPKPSCTLINSIHSNLSTSGNAMNVVSKEFQDSASNPAGLKTGSNYKEPGAHGFPESLQSPEKMTSVFARRVDALKHIIPTGAGDTTSYLRKSCLFCRKSGHGLRAFTEIKKHDLDGLLGNISSYDDETKGAPFLCIKCLQLDHWGSTYPWEGRLHLGIGNKRYFNMMEMEEFQSEGVGSFRMAKRHRGTDILRGKRKMFYEDAALSSGKDMLVGTQLTSSPMFLGKQISDAPKGMFDVIRRLRLSRTDILKWMNSHIPVAHLDGFFLRLRLAKWEEGTEGASYGVAFITGAQREKPTNGSKFPIHVSIGSVECFVESQYISNHDFLEDELLAWWHKTSKSGHVLTEEDLMSKLEERKKLGL